MESRSTLIFSVLRMKGSPAVLGKCYLPPSPSPCLLGTFAGKGRQYAKSISDP